MIYGDSEERKKKRRNKRAQEQRLVYGITGVVFLCVLVFSAAIILKFGKGLFTSDKDQNSQAKAPEEESLIPQPSTELQETEQETAELTEKEQKQEELKAKASQILETMTIDQKICQMFIVTPEGLTGYGTVTAAGDATKAALESYPVGGIVYFEKNIVNPEQTKQMLSNAQNYASEISGLPLFLCVDEEGGSVTRIGENTAFGVETFEDMASVTDTQSAYHVGDVIGTYLSEYGFNVDFAPDADVLTNTANTVIGSRSFGSDPQKVSELAGEVSKGLNAHKILSTFKHFPGHGATEGDSHKGAAVVDKSYEQLRESELIPFEKAEEYEVDFVMAGHISLPQILEDNTPSSLSSKMVTDVLRNDLGYQGLIVTDALNMEAITNFYSSGDAAVFAINAGNDMLLMPADFKSAIEGVKNAVSSGSLTEERIDESLLRIIMAKLDWMEN